LFYKSTILYEALSSNAKVQGGGIKILGKPRFISTSVKFDLSSEIELGHRVVISDRVILLTHDYSDNTGFYLIRKFTVKV
jgi:acetyltransferase-like isoleucine patch superfamily enzyme